MLHSVLMGIAFLLFIAGSAHRNSRINFLALGLAVLTLALFVGSDLHIHLHLNGDAAGNPHTTEMSYHHPVVGAHSRS